MWRWRELVATGREVGRVLGPRYFEIRYEDFVAEPKRVLKEAGAHCGLVWDADQLDVLTRDLENRNFKWRERFTSAESDTLHSLLGETLEGLGYSLARDDR